jgi:predicted nucleotidyltransferase component of viral defense system
LAILKETMLLPELQNFVLVGGTALALQIGHRISIDLDLFTAQDYDDYSVQSAVQKLGKMEIIVNKPPFLQLNLDDVKIDFLKYPYPFIEDYKTVEGVRMADIETIAVMKLLAASRRGVKKDFYDLYFILEQYSIAHLVALFEQKLPDIDMFHILKSLTYFGDADPEPDPKMLLKVSWATVKKVVTQKTQTYLRQL